MPLNQIDQYNLQNSVERAIERTKEREQFQAEVEQLAAEGKLSYFKGLLYFAVSIIGGTALGWGLGLVVAGDKPGKLPVLMIGGAVVGFLFGPRVLSLFIGRSVLTNCRRTFQLTLALLVVAVVLYIIGAVVYAYLKS